MAEVVVGYGSDYVVDCNALLTCLIYLLYSRCNGHAPLPADSAYFTTSESKAKFLTQYVKDMHNESISGTDTSEELIKQKVTPVITIFY